MTAATSIDTAGGMTSHSRETMGRGVDDEELEQRIALMKARDYGSVLRGRTAARRPALPAL